MGINALPGEEDIVIDVPSLQTVPVLPADYPLFDWADWPDSRAALVQGGMTKKFEKACWNAIIDTLADALEAAGIGFYDNGGTLAPEDLKMTAGKYGRLTAWKMNTTLDAIDDVVPLAWRWAYDASFRGYIGQSWFRGRTTSGKEKPHTVYPEYILELVRRVNLILELMRDTYPYTYGLAAKGYVNSLVRPGLVAGRGMPIIRSMNIPLLVSPAPLTVSKGVRLDPEVYSKIYAAFTPELLHAASIEMRMPMAAPIKVSGEVIRPGTMKLLPVISGIHHKTLVETTLPVRLAASVLSHPAAKAALELLEGTAMEAGILMRSRSWAEADQLPLVHTDARMQVFTRQRVTGAAVAAYPTERIQGHSHSLTQAAASTGLLTHAKTKPLGLYSSASVEGVAAPGTDGSVKVLAFSRQQAQADSVPPQYLVASNTSKLSSRTAITKLRTRPGWAEQKSGTLSLCSLGTAWDAPLWVDGGLWIRQARTIKILPDGSMDLSGSGDPIASRQESRTRITAILDNGWLAPIWVDGGLYIRQVREVRVLEDGSLDLTGAGDETKVRQGSKTRMAAALDTAWYPPVVVDGGLYLRQVYEEPVQNDNGELEVR